MKLCFVKLETFHCIILIGSIQGGNEDNHFSLDIFTHQLVATEVLDREERAQYSLIVQASDDCFHQPRHVTAFDPKDNSLLQVDIKVKLLCTLFYSCES